MGSANFKLPLDQAAPTFAYISIAADLGFKLSGEGGVDALPPVGSAIAVHPLIAAMDMGLRAALSALDSAQQLAAAAEERDAQLPDSEVDQHDDAEPGLEI